MKRGLAVALALGIAGLAAWLWLRPESPSHGEIDEASREALREVLRDAEAP